MLLGVNATTAAPVTEISPPTLPEFAKVLGAPALCQYFITLLVIKIDKFPGKSDGH